MVHIRIREQHETFFCDGMRKLVDCCRNVWNYREAIWKNNRGVTFQFLVVGKRILPFLFDLHTYFK
jgi:hypothetical protein